MTGTTVSDGAAAPDPAGAPAEGAARWIAMVAALALTVLGGWLLLRPPPRDPTPVAWGHIAPPETVPMRPWRWIVIHHSATGAGATGTFDREHHDVRGWEGVGYHFVIGNGRQMPLGRVEATFRWRNQQQGAHAGAGPEQRPYNESGIGVCLVGDFSTSDPDPWQLERAAQLLAVLVHQVPTLSLDRIIGHRDVPGKATSCPGAHLDLARLRWLVRTEMERRGYPLR